MPTVDPNVCTVQEAERLKFTTSSGNEICVRTCDQDALIELKAIVAALGGSSNVTTEIYNISIAVANTEESQAMPTNIAGYIIRTRGNTELKISHVSGESGTKYVTIPKRATHTDNHNYNNLTIYFQSPTAGDVVEILAWKI